MVFEFWSLNQQPQQQPGPVRNANSWAWAGSTESAVCFNKFPGDSDGLKLESLWSTCPQGIPAQGAWVSRRTLGEVVRIGVCFVTSQSVNGE